MVIDGQNIRVLDELTNQVSTLSLTINSSPYAALLSIDEILVVYKGGVLRLNSEKSNSIILVSDDIPDNMDAASYSLRALLLLDRVYSKLFLANLTSKGLSHIDCEMCDLSSPYSILVVGSHVYIGGAGDVTELTLTGELMFRLNQS